MGVRVVLYALRGAAGERFNDTVGTILAWDADATDATKVLKWKVRTDVDGKVYRIKPENV